MNYNVEYFVIQQGGKSLRLQNLLFVSDLVF